jgi:hypothetical protein
VGPVSEPQGSCSECSHRRLHPCAVVVSWVLRRRLHCAVGLCRLRLSTIIRRPCRKPRPPPRGCPRLRLPLRRPRPPRLRRRPCPPRKPRRRPHPRPKHPRRRCLRLRLRRRPHLRPKPRRRRCPPLRLRRRRPPRPKPPRRRCPRLRLRRRLPPPRRRQPRARLRPDGHLSPQSFFPGCNSGRGRLFTLVRRDPLPPPRLLSHRGHSFSLSGSYSQILGDVPRLIDPAIGAGTRNRSAEERQILALERAGRMSLAAWVSLR